MWYEWLCLGVIILGVGIIYARAFISMRGVKMKNILLRIWLAITRPWRWR